MHLSKMELYDKFRCTAKECTFTCCKGWDISIDAKTHEKWRKEQQEEYFTKHLKLSKRKDAPVLIRMTSQKRCPFLSSDELCDIVIQYGEDYLSKTCRTFPRIENQSNDCTEYSLSCACPEVVDMLHQVKDIIITTDAIFKECKHKSVGYQIRDIMINLMMNQNFTLQGRMKLIFHMLLELRKQQESMEAVLVNYQEDSYLEDIVGFFEELAIPFEASFEEMLELFLDITQNFRKEATYKPYLEDIYEKAQIISSDQDEWMKFAISFQEYDELLAKCIITKLYAIAINDEIDDLILDYQLIITEYSMVRLSAFLLHGIGQLPYTKLRDYIVVYSRILGYNAEGIIEFWEESFDEAVWELGYLLLLIE